VKEWSVLRLWAICLMLWFPIASFASSLASPEENRRAKQALPPTGQALVYVYRTDGGARVGPTIAINKRELGALAPRTFYMVPVAPGRIDLRAGGETISIRGQGGRVYFVHLAVDSAGKGALNQVSYGRGRREVHAASLAKIGTSTVSKSGAKQPASTPEPPDATRDGFNLIVKVGSYSLASGTQTVVIPVLGPATLNYSTGSTTLVVEGEWITTTGWAFGAEYMGHSHEYVSTAGTGDLSASLLMINVKKYFRYGATVQPYLGIGIGSAFADLSGGISGSAGGFAAQVMGGVAFRWQHVGLYTEFKQQTATTKDANSQEIDLGGSGLFVGVSAFF